MRARSDRLTDGIALLLGTIIALGLYQVAEWLAPRWNPFL